MIYLGTVRATLNNITLLKMKFPLLIRQSLLAIRKSLDKCYLLLVTAIANSVPQSGMLRV